MVDSCRTMISRRRGWIGASGSSDSREISEGRSMALSGEASVEGMVGSVGMMGTILAVVATTGRTSPALVLDLRSLSSLNIFLLRVVVSVVTNSSKSFSSSPLFLREKPWSWNILASINW